MAEAKRQEAEMETTESYRGPVREISNVERFYAPANDNKPKALRRTAPAPGTGARVPNTRSRRSALSRTAGVSPAIEKGVNVVNAALVLDTIVWITIIIYPIQLAFALLYLLGLGAWISLEESFLDYIDVFDFGAGVAELMFFGSLVVLFLIGLFSLFIALGLFWERGVKLDVTSVMLIAPICIVLYIFPVFNLLPWIVFWCMYVVKNQVKE